MTQNRTHAHIFDLEPDSLEQLLIDHKLPKFRANQVLKWVYEQYVTDPDEMTNLSKLDRRRIGELLTLQSCDIVRTQNASDGTQKLLVKWNAGTSAQAGDRALLTECVMIPAVSRPSSIPESASRTANKGGKLRRTACISSQVGCPVGCRFCASGMDGLDANLSSGQMVEQIVLLNQLLKTNNDQGIKNTDNDKITSDILSVTNVVFMGMGEPLANIKALKQAIRTITAPWGLGISARRVTVSTVGLPDGIRELADFGVPVTLALSLHAPTDALRKKLIPWANNATIAEILDACRYYFNKTGREITLEYTLMHEVNDREEHAFQLVKIARTLRANINLIRYNEVPSLPFKRPTAQSVHDFQAILRSRNVNTHIRASRGRDIDAACGQLAKSRS